MQSLGERVLDELETDIKLRKRLAELLIREPDLRLVLVNAALATVATREDIRELRAEMRGEIGQLRTEMNQLRAEMNQLRNEMKGEINQLRGEISQLRGEIAQLRVEMSSNLRWTIGTMLAIWGATVIPILLRLIGML